MSGKKNLQLTIGHADPPYMLAEITSAADKRYPVAFYHLPDC